MLQHAYFKTEKFRQALEDDEIDQVVLGEDCIAWLRDQLSGHIDIATERPLSEDWGWTMAVSVSGSELWLNVQDWSFEESQTWHAWMESRGVVAWLASGRNKAARARLRQALDESLSSDSAIREVRWSDVG